MLGALSSNFNLSCSNIFLLNVGFFSKPNGILAANPRNFCIFKSRAGTGPNLLSSKTRASTSSDGILPENQVRHQFPVSYLIDTCGFSPEEAVVLAKRMNVHRFDPSRFDLDRPDIVLALLKDYGFDDYHITKIIRADPYVLVCKPEDRLIPKFEFFRSLGISGNDLADLMASSNVIGRSLERRIIPCYEILKSVLVDDAKVVEVIKGYSLMFRYDVKERLGSNVEALRQAHVPESVISFALFNHFPLFIKPKDKFKAGVDEAIRLGYDSSQVTFIRELNALIKMRKSIMGSEKETPKKWGIFR